MNKKFSTLLAGLMLAASITVGAQTVSDKYENGKYYLLGTAAEANGTTSQGYLALKDANSKGLYEYTLVSSPNANLADLTYALWKVEVDETAISPSYKFVNRATGRELTIDLSAALAANDLTNGAVAENLQLDGSVSVWNNGISSLNITEWSPLMNYFAKAKADSVVYFAKSGSNVVAYKEDVTKLGNTATGVAPAPLYIRPYTAANLVLSATDLNTQLRTLEKNENFTLSFDADVTAGETNLFSSNLLVAQNVTDVAYDQIPADENDGPFYLSDGTPVDQADVITNSGGELVDANTGNRVYKSRSYTSPYVTVQAKDKKVDDKQAYIVVDTALYTSTENAGHLVKLNLDALYTKNRLAESYQFKFTYNPNNDEVLIQSRGFLFKKATKVNNREWYADGTNYLSDRYVRIAELGSATVVRVITFDAATTPAEQNTKVKIATSAVDALVPTTIAEGYYLIQYKSTGANQVEKNNAYYLANLRGQYAADFDWIGEIEGKQNFQHMPAAHWVVTKNSTASTARITITNREFPEKADTRQLYEVKGTNNYFYYNGNSIDTVSFIPVSNPKDYTVGYKYLTADEASVEKYVFNYLHGLSLDKGLNTPYEKDSVVRVDETGEKMKFQLELIVLDDTYGYKEELKRNAYYIRVKDATKLQNDRRYLKYDEKLKKYVVSEVTSNENPTAYFLKENNCITEDGKTTHYYTLVEANLVRYGATFLGNDENKTYYNKDAKAYYPITESYGSRYVNYLVYNKNGYAFVTDMSDIAHQDLYYYTVKDDKVQLAALFPDAAATDKRLGSYSYDYASAKVSVDDATLDLTQGSLEDKFNTDREIRTSAFAVIPDDSPLYRRFDQNEALGEEYGDETNSPAWLKFFKYNNYGMEFLAENSYDPEGKRPYRNDLNDNSISFLGLYHKDQYEEKEDVLSYTFYVDTAYVRNETRMPQYMLALRPQIQEGQVIPCGENHATEQEMLECPHTIIVQRMVRGMWLVNAQDSVNAKNTDYQGKIAYGAEGLTRLAFVDGIHARDTFYVLRGENANLSGTHLNLDKLKFRPEDKIELDQNTHKNMVFSFRLIDDANRRFLIETESSEGIAPENGAWVKIQNGVPVIVRTNINSAMGGEAEIFDVMAGEEGTATSTDKVNTTEVKVIAAEGKVTILNAAGKKVVINNILGQTVANTVLSSDNATIAAPKGIVVVAVEGEEAVKAIVK